MDQSIDRKFLEQAIRVAERGMRSGKGGPFGCIVVRDGIVLAEGCNEVTSSNDPTAHAEVVAIRRACAQLGDFQLTGCVIYASCEPCPMCLGAIYWARPLKVVYASSRQEAATIGFDDEFIYREISLEQMQRAIPFLHKPHPAAKELFEAWKDWEGKTPY
jgi:tRNA(Arg) A34 adenosine deaminase TadA